MPWALLTNRFVVAGAALVALGLALWVQSARLDAAKKSEVAAAQVAAQWRTNFQAMQATNAANVAALEKLKAEAARIAAHAASARHANAKLATDIETLRRRIAHANPTDDGPVRPVLCDTVNELRRIGGQAGAACGGSNESRGP